MSKPLSPVERFTWVMMQSLWVGGLWITILVVYPSLSNTLLAPLLIHDVVNNIASRINIMAIICIVVQLILFVKVSGFIRLTKNAVGFGLISALLFSISFFLVHKYLLNPNLSVFFYLATGLSGFFIMFNLPPWLQEQRELYLRWLKCH